MRVFRMRQSFKGREYTKLRNKLLAEQSGILNLVLDGWARVKARGGLRQVGSGEELSESFAELGSDVLRFVAERCDVGPKYGVLLSQVYAAWKNWMDAHGLRYPWPDNVFSGKLNAAIHLHPLEPPANRGQ
jgi:phage/plasmid-associated DNA primase